MDWDALAALRLQIEFGADEALEDAPVDRLRPPPASAPVAVAVRTRVAAPPITVAPRTPAVPTAHMTAAARAADGHRGRSDARCAVRRNRQLRRLRTARHRDPAGAPAGDPAAGLLLIGEPPSAEDDRAGRPFAGPAGGTLDRMLASIALDRSKLLLAPLIPWRPPGNRPPTAAEVAICLPFLHRLIQLSAPRRVVLLGTLAARTLLATTRRRAPAWTELVLPGTAGGFPVLGHARTRRRGPGTGRTADRLGGVAAAATGFGCRSRSNVSERGRKTTLIRSAKLLIPGNVSRWAGPVSWGVVALLQSAV